MPGIDLNQLYPSTCNSSEANIGYNSKFLQFKRIWLEISTVELRIEDALAYKTHPQKRY